MRPMSVFVTLGMMRQPPGERARQIGLPHFDRLNRHVRQQRRAHHGHAGIGMPHHHAVADELAERGHATGVDRLLAHHHQLTQGLGSHVHSGFNRVCLEHQQPLVG